MARGQIQIPTKGDNPVNCITAQEVLDVSDYVVTSRKYLCEVKDLQLIGARYADVGTYTAFSRDRITLISS